MGRCTACISFSQYFSYCLDQNHPFAQNLLSVWQGLVLLWHQILYPLRCFCLDGLLLNCFTAKPRFTCNMCFRWNSGVLERRRRRCFAGGCFSGLPFKQKPSVHFVRNFRGSESKARRIFGCLFCFIFDLLLCLVIGRSFPTRTAPYFLTGLFGVGLCLISCAQRRFLCQFFHWVQFLLFSHRYRSPCSRDGFFFGLPIRLS